MVPLVRYSNIGGLPLNTFMSEEKIDQIVERTRKGGAEIVGLLKTGSAYYAPSASAVEMAEAILKDQHRILPCAAMLSGEYGVNDLYIGVQCRLGGNGLEKVIELDLTDDEKKNLQVSIDAVQGLVDSLKNLDY